MRVDIMMFKDFLKNNRKRLRKGSIILKNLNNHHHHSHEKGVSNSALLRLAVRRFDKERVTELVMDKGVNINGANGKGITALHEASIDGNLVCLQILLDGGADINCTDAEGYTPLDYAVYAGDFDVATYLIQRGAKEDRIRDGQIIQKKFKAKYRSATVP